MPELTHDTAEDGFHEIQLSGKQLVFVGMTVTIVFVAIFLCGVLVGRNTRPPRDGEFVETAAASGPAAPASTPATDAAGPPATEPPAPPVEDLTYHKRLQGNTRPEEPKANQKPQDPAPAAAKPPAPAAAAPAPVDVPTSGRAGTWFVQVSALQNRTAATNEVKGLIKQGYPAYLELPQRGAVVLYKVRVGRYRDKSEADRVARRLKEEKLSAQVGR